ncbi:MAG: sigma-54-dependent Fis family transcriptional regulator [Planctomycetes bacterium]|nr:sigma-54-dependent Fis family transcriptional regulator [Planctomycetota bacterium]
MTARNADDEVLHAAAVESLERRIVQLALERTQSRNGAIFLWDTKEQGLVAHFHIVEDVVLDLPGAVLRGRSDGRPGGIALWVMDHNQPYLCPDSREDAHYTMYFLDVRSIAAVPIPWQGRPIGVLSVSSQQPHAFTPAHLDELESLAASSAKFLRRAQLSRARHGQGRRPFLIKGLSPEWLDVERRIEHVSPTDAPVLIQGESGTGKELVAHAIHFNSGRAEKPFVVVNCAAIPESMLESTLFGHVRGAFTGATHTRLGEFKKADGGILFLDEVGELALPLQAKLLRAVEQGEIQPLGSNAPPERVDVRLIGATHRDLSVMAREGRFREDLYYRLSVVTIDLPPLRRYKHNLEVLAGIFLQQANRQHGKDIQRLSPAALAALRAHEYPGNVRELRNIIEHAVVMSSGEEIRAEDLPRSVRTPPATQAPRTALPERTLADLREEWMAPQEKRYLVELLEGTQGNVRRAAARAGVNPVTLYRLLHRHGIALERAVRS